FAALDARTVDFLSARAADSAPVRRGLAAPVVFEATLAAPTSPRGFFAAVRARFARGAVDAASASSLAVSSNIGANPLLLAWSAPPTPRCRHATTRAALRLDVGIHR